MLNSLGRLSEGPGVPCRCWGAFWTSLGGDTWRLSGEDGCWEAGDGLDNPHGPLVAGRVPADYRRVLRSLSSG